jgi:hypothetical protein
LVSIDLLWNSWLESGSLSLIRWLFSNKWSIWQSLRLIWIELGFWLFKEIWILKDLNEFVWFKLFCVEWVSKRTVRLEYFKKLIFWVFKKLLQIQLPILYSQYYLLCFSNIWIINRQYRVSKYFAYLKWVHSLHQRISNLYQFFLTLKCLQIQVYLGQYILMRYHWELHMHAFKLSIVGYEIRKPLSELNPS